MAYNKYGINKATIIPVDGIVIVEGDIIEMDLSAMDPTINAIQIQDGVADIEYLGEDVNEQTDDLRFIDWIIGGHKDKKTLRDKRKADPLYGYKGDELKRKRNELDLRNARAEFIRLSREPVTVHLPEGNFKFPGTKEMSVDVLLARESAILSAKPDVVLVDYYGEAHTFSITSANRIFATLGEAYRERLNILKGKEKEIKDRK